MSALTELEAAELLRKYEIPIIESCLVTSINEALVAADRIGYPVVIKVLSPDILHKTDVGGVEIGIADEAALRTSWHRVMASVSREMPRAAIQGMLVQRMAKKGTEVIIGGVRDDFFGPVIMFGFGGVFTEVFEDVAFRLAPITPAQALEMTESTRAHKILAGARHQTRRDVDRKSTRLNSSH